MKLITSELNQTPPEMSQTMLTDELHTVLIIVVPVWCAILRTSHFMAETSHLVVQHQPSQYIFFAVIKPNCIIISIEIVTKNTHTQ
jgi:fumarate reductase subunit D